MTAACRLPVRTLAEAEQARRAGRSLAAALGFTPAEQETVALAIMELATNLVR